MNQQDRGSSEATLFKGIAANSPFVETIGKARDLLRTDGENSPYDSPYNCSTELIRLCTPCNDWDIVSRIITAATIRHPYRAYNWVPRWEPLLLQNPENWQETYGPPTGAFALGASLSLFEGAAWLDQYACVGDNGYLRMMPMLTRELLTSLRRQTSWTAKLGDSLLPDKKWEGRLASAVAAWNKGGPLGHFRQQRMGQLFAVLDDGIGPRTANQLEEILPAWTLILLEKLAYTALGTLGQAGRAYLITLGLRDLLKPVRELLRED